MKAKMNIILQRPFVDSGRIVELRRSLIDAYAKKDAVAVKNAAKGIQQYIDKGGDFPLLFTDYDVCECLTNSPHWMADKYILRVLHDRHLEDDEDQCYIATGLIKSMAAAPIQLSLF